MNAIFAHNIKNIREKWGLSQEAFGELFGASRMMVAQYEIRGSKPKYFIRKAMEEVTGLSFDTLCNVELSPDDVSNELKKVLCFNTDIHSRIIVSISALKDVGIIRRNADIAEDLGYSRPGTISEIINGKIPISHRFINSFSSKYGVSLDWIQSGNGSIFLAQPVTGTLNIAASESKSRDDEFSEFLRNKRREFDLTKAMLSHFSGKPLADITAWEDGTAVASPETQADLYMYFKSLSK